ncbi:MAG: type II toxin-antitoxin system prevent-host-death family antitoxin [bacterium]
MIEIPLDKIKENIIEVIGKASNGEEVIVTQNDYPIVKITSAKKKQKAVFGSGKDKIIFISEDFDSTPEEFKEYQP